ncbi:MAG: hypothetical protein Q8J69_07865 [Sphingobacteriaceae bacterium]|nr:hypothetical protein [Sphingobacteriaceae bacterium]
MKKILSVLFFVAFSASVWAQSDFKLRRVHLYRGGAAMLEYAGEVATRQARFQMPLPAGALTQGVHVRVDDREKLVNYLVHHSGMEIQQPLATKKALLAHNQGYNIKVECFEGNDGVSYAGEVMRIDTTGELLFLRSGNSIEVIPISTIMHISGGAALNVSKSVQQLAPTLSVYLVGDYNALPITVLVPITGFESDARYLLDFDKSKPELSLDLTINAPMKLDEVDILYYNHAFQEREVAAFSSQAAFRLAGVNILPNTRSTYQVLSTEVPLQLSDEVDVDAWEPLNQNLSMKSSGKRYLSLSNNSVMDWFSTVVYERKGLSLGLIPSKLPEVPKKATVKMEYGPSPYILTDNARLVKVVKKAVSLNGMKYDSYLYVGRIEIRNTSREAGRVRIIKHAVPDSRRNYWFANSFIDLKGKTKQEMFQLEYEVKVEANDVAFYSYRYELLIPSDN